MNTLQQIKSPHNDDIGAYYNFSLYVMNKYTLWFTSIIIFLIYFFKSIFFILCTSLDIMFFLIYNIDMEIDERINNIKESVLKFVPAKYIYLFGSYAYGNPTEKSDIDVYIVTPDNMNNFSELYTKIIGDLSNKKIFFIDLLMNTESVFDVRKVKNILERTIYQKGKIIYGH